MVASGPSGAVPDLACAAAELEWAALDFVYALGALRGAGVAPDAGTAAQRALHDAALAYAQAGGYHQVAAVPSVDSKSAPLTTSLLETRRVTPQMTTIRRIAGALGVAPKAVEEFCQAIAAAKKLPRRGERTAPEEPRMGQAHQP